MKNSNKSSEIFYSKVALLLKEKKYLAAKNLIINSANTLEKDARYYFYLGLANKFLKLYDEALENFQKVLIENKNYVNCYIQIASIMDIKRNYSKEIDSLKTAQKIDVKDERISYLLGRAFRKTRKYSEAIEELQKVKSDFKKEQVILSLAECYRGLKKQNPQ